MATACDLGEVPNAASTADDADGRGYDVRGPHASQRPHCRCLTCRGIHFSVVTPPLPPGEGRGEGVTGLDFRPPTSGLYVYCSCHILTHSSIYIYARRAMRKDMKSFVACAGNRRKAFGSVDLKIFFLIFCAYV